jgi:hypothetical protein
MSQTEQVKMFITCVLEEEPITEKDIADESETFRAMEVSVRKTTEENVDTVVSRLEAGSSDILTDIAARCFVKLTNCL